MPTKKEIASLRELLRKANAEGELLSAAEKGRQLTNLLAYLESAVVLARRMAEEQSQPPITKAPVLLSGQSPRLRAALKPMSSAGCISP